MMNEHDVVDILESAERIGVGVWLDGGWGVDALVGRQTRPHNDIDVFIEKRNAGAFTAMITEKGYYEISMEYTTKSHSVWQDSDERIIDLHLFECGVSGTLIFENEVYPSDVFNGKGMIGGVAVNCLTAEAQLLYHQGDYEKDENDAHDVLLLCGIFNFPIPSEYKSKADID